MLRLNSAEYWPESTSRYDSSSVNRISPQSFVCGYCSNKVSSEIGYPIYNSNLTVRDNEYNAGNYGGVYICPECLQPSYFYKDNQVPGPLVGKEVDHLTEDLSVIYNEIRKNISNSCYTSAVLLSRKLLMNIAVEQGAKENLKFYEYVDYLSNKGYTPPKSKPWVDSIRKKGNVATHEIKLMEEKDAVQLLLFLEMILIYLYSFPAMMKQ